ncbi:hypothetical protein [Yunchengibacter salinarum]|uniref:hypothetical protein n=1 Tax=Yunchengibacter salinarum TaxID=3133399 RepID=UPI0035B59109
MIEQTTSGAGAFAAVQLLRDTSRTLRTQTSASFGATSAQQAGQGARPEPDGLAVSTFNNAERAGRSAPQDDTADVLRAFNDAVGDSLTARNQVQDTTASALTAVDLSVATAGQVAGLLGDLRNNALDANRADLPAAQRSAINTAFIALRNQISETLQQAGFNNVNPLTGEGNITIQRPGGNRETVFSGRDLSPGGDTIPLGPDNTLSSPGATADSLAAIEDSIANVAAVIADLQSQGNALQAELTRQAAAGSDSIASLFGAEEDGNRQAAEVREGLGRSGSSITNASPLSVFSLFSVF